MDPYLANKIIKAVQHAKAKHPFFCENLPHAVCLATEELGELAKAVNDGKQDRNKSRGTRYHSGISADN